MPGHLVVMAQKDPNSSSCSKKSDKYQFPHIGKISVIKLKRIDTIKSREIIYIYIYIYIYSLLSSQRHFQFFLSFSLNWFSLYFFLLYFLPLFRLFQWFETISGDLCSCNLPIRLKIKDKSSNDSHWNNRIICYRILRVKKNSVHRKSDFIHWF